MTKYRFNKQNRMNKHNKRATASRCRESIEMLRIPKYIRDAETNALDITLAQDEIIRVGITDHAAMRMTQRRITTDAIAVAMKYGRVVHANNAIIYFLGNKELKKALGKGQKRKDWERFRHIHVVVSAENNAIITTYKNSKLLIKA